MNNSLKVRANNRMRIISIFIIAIISFYDIYLSAIYSDHLDYLEQNLICRWLIYNGGLNFFLLLKFISTLMVCAICFHLLKTKYKIAIYGVLIFQIYLFLFLNFYTESKYKKVSFEEMIILR
jgi:hypothetical protein